MEYQRFFTPHDRLTGKKPIAVLKTDLLSPFVAALLADTMVDDEFKALVFISLSGGLRVSEALNLTREDFSEEDGMLLIRSKVLKKRKADKRWARIHPQAADFMKEYVKNKVGKVVKMSQPTAFRRMKRHFAANGICNHSLRHSNISYLLFEENLTHIKAAKLLHVSVETVEHYAHLDEKRALRGLFN